MWTPPSPPQFRRHRRHSTSSSSSSPSRSRRIRGSGSGSGNNHHANHIDENRHQQQRQHSAVPEEVNEPVLALVLETATTRRKKRVTAFYKAPSRLSCYFNFGNSTKKSPSSPVLRTDANGTASLAFTMAGGYQAMKQYAMEETERELYSQKSILV